MIRMLSIQEDNYSKELEDKLILILINKRNQS